MYVLNPEYVMEPYARRRLALVPSLSVSSIVPAMLCPARPSTLWAFSTVEYTNPP